MERQARAELHGGTIINVSSYATIDPFPTLYAYAAAKASVNLLAKSVSVQGKALGIRGFAVAPGCVDTDLLRSLVTEDQVPLSKRLMPAAVAQVIADCVQGKRDAENGQVILVPSP
jgi:NAD(P)-dependent dehydrogenase (short-subunit alcohol dehydrogenase family)